MNFENDFVTLKSTTKAHNECRQIYAFIRQGEKVCYYQSKIILCSYLLINLVILQEMFLAKWNQNTVRSFVKKRFLYSSTNYKLISLLDMTSKHYANLLPISLVFQSQYSIAVLNYTVQFSIRFQENASGTTDLYSQPWKATISETKL